MALQTVQDPGWLLGEEAQKLVILSLLAVSGLVFSSVLDLSATVLPGSHDPQYLPTKVEWRIAIYDQKANLKQEQVADWS